MAEQFLTFRKFTNPVESDDLIALLQEHAIPFQAEDASANFDISFSGNTHNKEVHIKLRPADFEKVNNLIVETSDYQTDEFPDDYYLFQFNNEELTEILIKPDEWSAVDYNLAQKILKQRGKDVRPEFLDTLRKKRNEVLAKPEKSQKTWVYAGYFFALAGGLIGLFIGWHLLTYKKTLPNGKRVHGYNLSDRKHGRNILILGTIFGLMWLLINLGYD